MEAISQTLVNFLGSGATWLVRLFLAVLVLALGWFIAKVVSKIVRQILQTANFDRRLGRWLTLDEEKDEQEKPKRQIAGVIEAIVYYLLLVIFVIFALEVLGDKTITMVLQNILNDMGSAVPKILKALLVLAGAWLIALVVKFAVIKILRSIQFSERFEKAMKVEAEEGKKPRRDMAESFGNFLFYFILLFALLPFLDALQLTALVDPLKAMFAKVLGYAPNVFMAVAVLVLGYFLARICERISTNFARAAGINRFIEGMRFESVLKSVDVARIIGTVVFLLVLVPVLGSAFQIVDLPVITSAFGTMIGQVAAAIPRILGAFILLILGLIVGRYVGDFVEQILKDVGFDVILSRLGLERLEKKEGTEEGHSRTLSNVVGNLVMAVIVLFALMEGFRIVKLDMVADAVDKLILFLPEVLIAFLILGVGFYLAKVLEGIVQRSFASERTIEANIMGLVLRYAVIVFAFFMAFDELGIAHSVVVTAFTILLATAGLGLALAFGLGGRDQAQRYLEHLKEYADERRKKQQKP
jgi:small-conductance mechanosensitive channel